MDVRKGVEISGIVQGVGFRPHVYRLATERRLDGLIRNTPAGVDIEIQGDSLAVDDFVARVPAEAPPLARVTAVRVRDLPCNRDKGFRIVESTRGEAVCTLIAPDVAICADCRRELFDPGDRRYLYPFINCTNCGPRFTIVRDLPYDRFFTSMAAFRMCPACQGEYDDPLNRRFHAQPNACWTCGPQVELRDGRGRRMEAADPIAEAASHLLTGDVVAVKGLGGFHLAVDATNRQAVERLRERKRRVEKPFAIMAPDLFALEQFCEVDATARELLQQAQCPIVLLPRKPGSSVSEAVAPGNRDVGVFLPYTPLHHLLLAAGGFTALVMTSGNLSEEPIAIGNQEALGRLSGIADCFLVHNRDILLRCDDSVVRTVAGRTRQQRRSRGYAPTPVFVAQELPPVLAVGGELKNTVCLAQGKHAFLSQHIGDLENLESFRFFEEAILHLERILQIRPGIVAYDLHPDYFSTRWALAQGGMQKVGVQHHHAHVASCMAENGLDGCVIGISLDGTGYGTDGHIWGGEVLLADFIGFQRAAHFRYVPMPGGAAAIHEPWRMAVSYLVQYFGDGLLKLRIPFVERLHDRPLDVMLRMMERGVNSPLTSSCGRLFDAVAALIGMRDQVTYEAQAAIELEMAARDSADSGSYRFALANDPDGRIIDPEPVFRDVVRDLERNVPASTISRRFHMGLVHVFTTLAIQLRADTGVDRVCLSGGTFQNALLFDALHTSLVSEGFRAFGQCDVPAGDGGLCLGQAVVAARRVQSMQMAPLGREP